MEYDDTNVHNKLTLILFLTPLIIQWVWHRLFQALSRRMCTLTW